ncbi:MAG TPA: hypothetical protein VGK00_02090 [Anaerolineales bacterium]|jgi:hypothetical protein
MKLRLTPLILSTLLVAAHFLRSYSLLPMFVSLAAPLLLLVKKRWSLLVLQVLCVVAAFIWMLALYGIIQQRLLEGRSWLASGLILGTVALFTLFSGWLLNSPQVKDNYPVWNKAGLS